MRCSGLVSLLFVAASRSVGGLNGIDPSVSLVVSVPLEQEVVSEHERSEDAALGFEDISVLGLQRSVQLSVGSRAKGEVGSASESSKDVALNIEDSSALGLQRSVKLAAGPRSSGSATDKISIGEACRRPTIKR